MRVCDITKSEQVATRYIILNVSPDQQGPLFDDEGKPSENVRVVHDIEVGTSAAQAIEAKRWNDLHTLTPASERPKNEARSEAAKKAGKTRADNKAKAAASADEPDDDKGATA